MSANNVINAINAIDAMCVCVSEPPFPGGTLSLGLLPALSPHSAYYAQTNAPSARVPLCSLSLSPSSHALYFFSRTLVFLPRRPPLSLRVPLTCAQHHHMCWGRLLFLGQLLWPYTLDLRRVYAMSARTTARGAGARSAGERASARISAGGADARSAGGRASARTSASGANARSAGGEHLPAPAREEQMQGVRGSRHLPAPAREKLMQEPWELRGGAGRVNRARAVRRVCLGW